MQKILLATLAVLLGLGSPAIAAEPKFPELTGPVVDVPDEIPAAAEARLDAKLREFQKRTGHQLQVAIIAGLDGETIADYGYKLGRHWDLGRAGARDGIILIHSPSDRKIRIEVSNGAQGYITDAKTSVIREGVIVPYFRKGDFAGGIEAGADAIMKEASITKEQRAEDQQRIDAANARRSQAAKDAFLNFLTYAGLVVAAIGGVFAAWFGATAKSRRLKREAAEAAEAARLLKISEAREAARVAREEENARLLKEREDILAAMSPEDRRRFLDDEREAALAAQNREDERRRIQKKRDDEDRERRRIQKEKDDAEDERRREKEERESASTTGYAGGSILSSGSDDQANDAPAPWTGGGGGDGFDGGGSDGSY
jgi:uncharacterized membrane protein YgcG